VLDRLTRVLFLATLALVPWGGLLRLSGLHENAQWSDLVFALAALAWAGERLRSGAWPRLRLVHAGLALYLGWAALSFVVASPRAASGPAKLLGMAMLVTLFLLTSELLARPGMARAVGWTVALGALASAVAAALGVWLSGRGIVTPLVGHCGDLVPGPVARAQAGFPHPNLLASYCIFASAIVAREDAGLPRFLRRLVQAALAVTVVLTTSRAILAFLLSLAIRHARTPAPRRLAAVLAAVLVATLVALSVWNVELDPLRPWQARLSAEPSSRRVSAETSLATLAERPLFGVGPGHSPGRRFGLPFDAHLTPLNVAATLGLPALAGLLLALAALWRSRRRPSDPVAWGLLAGLGLDALAQDVEDFRHVWVALGLADAGRGSGLESMHRAARHPNA
jgi:hypothetical protein